MINSVISTLRNTNWRNAYESFIYGNLYPIIFSITTFVFWVLNLQLVGFALLVAMGCFILFTRDDMSPLLPLLLLVPMCFRNSMIFNNQVAPYLILILPFFAIIYNFIKNKAKLTIDNLGICLLFFLACMLLGGFFSPFLSSYTLGFPLIAIAGIAMPVIHVFFISRIKLNNKVDLKKYFAYSFICAINVACAQLIYARTHVALFGDVVFKFPSFCWANTNLIGNLLLLAVPMCLYLLLSTKSIAFYLFEIILLYFCVFLSKSDGCTAILLSFTPILIFVTLKYCHRCNYSIIYNFCIAIIALAFFVVEYLLLFHTQLIFDFAKKLISDNGRSGLYFLGLEAFINHPIFGTGFGYGSILSQKHTSYFHSSIIQILSCSGLVGLMSFVLLYVVRIKNLLKNQTIFGSFAFIAFVMFGCYALIDNGEFNMVTIYVTLLIAIASIINTKRDSELPLERKKFS